MRVKGRNVARPERRLGERNQIEEPGLDTVLRLCFAILSQRDGWSEEREEHERGRSSRAGMKVWMRLEGMDRIDKTPLGWFDRRCHAHAIGVATPVMRYPGFIVIMD